MQTKTKKDNHLLIEVLILLCLILLAAALYFIYSSRKTTKISSVQTPTQQITATPEPTFTPVPPSPTPTPKPMQHGKASFSVSVGSEMKGPRMGAGTLDPYDVAKGGRQTMTIEVADKTPVQKVVAILKTDHKTAPEVGLKLLSGTPAHGIWGAEWTVDDSYLYTYNLTIRATSASGTSEVGILFR